MRVGVPKEIKDKEGRVGLTPAGVKALTSSANEVLVETSAGQISGFSDDQYRVAGAKILGSAAEVYATAEMIVKVKEPVAVEYPLLRESQLLFTFLHLAPLPALTKVLLDRKVTGVAYETVTDRDGSLPLLTPMSEVAGRMSIQVGCHYLERTNGGRGVLLSGVPGVAPAEVVILGGGVVGVNAAKVAVGLGARVTIIDRSAPRLRFLDDLFGGRATTLMSNPLAVEEALQSCDLAIGAVLIHGASAPVLATREVVRTMRPGAVVVDVAVDQGGCFETTHATTHSAPTYDVDGVIHYGVANMPGAVPRTSTFALTNVTTPYVLAFANLGFEGALARHPGLAPGVSSLRGHLTCQPVAEAQGLAYTALSDLL